MNRLDKQYQELLQTILDYGVEKKDRTGTGTKSIFGYTIRHKMSDGFPLLTTKKMAWKTMVTELLWFLRGDTNIKYLVDNNCHIWDGDAYKRYWDAHPDAEKSFQYEGHNMEVRRMTKDEFINMIKTDDEFAKKWGELGPIYGAAWRKWPSIKRIGIENGGTIHKAYPDYGDVDQIQNLINDLKTNPDSRRLMVNAWNVGELDQMVLPPCHYGFQVYTRELSFEERYVILKSRTNEDPLKYSRLDNGDYDQHPKEMTTKWMNEENIPTRAISLMWNQRSCDVPLGIPMNIASYALLLTIIATEVNMVPDELIGNLGDCHIYLNQIDGVNEQLTRESFELPKLVISNQVNFGKGIDEILNSCLITDFVVENYKSHPKIYFPLSN
jgi:thymidylate synthase